MDCYHLSDLESHITKPYNSLSPKHESKPKLRGSLFSKNQHHKLFISSQYREPSNHTILGLRLLKYSGSACIFFKIVIYSGSSWFFFSFLSYKIIWVPTHLWIRNCTKIEEVIATFPLPFNWFEYERIFGLELHQFKGSASNFSITIDLVIDKKISDIVF